jgi:NAD(P)-dependent dehydrogenase (short-subunit alcohol dehydrogenase family)
MYILLGPHLGGRAAPWWPARRDLVNLGRRWARLDGQADAEDEARAGAEALHVFANCAGGFWKQPSVEDTPEDERERVVDLNRRRCYSARRPRSRRSRQRSGWILNVGSIAGVTGSPGTSPPYAATACTRSRVCSR